MDMSDRIKQRMNALGIKAVDIVNRTGLTKGTVSQWVNGQTKPRGANLAKLTGVLRCTPEWLMFGSRENKESTVEESAGAYQVTKLIPLISWVSAGDFCEASDPLHPGDAEDWLPCPSNIGPHAYALRVVGDSMTSPYPGQRSYPEGTIIFIDPDRPAVNGSRVIVKLVGSQEVTFKALAEDSGQRFLRPINPQYPTIPITEDAHVCGVVVGSYWPE